MFQEEDFINFMQSRYNIKVDKSNIGSEAVNLYKEELESSLIPCDVLNEFPDPILFQLYTYQNDNEWNVGIAVDEATYTSLFLICLKDGEKIHEERLYMGERKGK